MPLLSEGKYYVYVLAYPELMGGEVFYIGKGTNNGIVDRIDMHEIEARKGEGTNPQKLAAIHSIWDHGYQVVKSKLAYFEDEQEAYMYEWGLIHMAIHSDKFTNQKPGACTPKGKAKVGLPLRRKKKIVRGEHRIFQVEGGYQVFWCPHYNAGYTDDDKLAEARPVSEKIYPQLQGAQRRKKQLNDALKDVDKMIARDGAIIL